MADAKLYQDAKLLLELTINIATGTSWSDDANIDYQRLRRELIVIKEVKGHLPGFIRDCHDLGAFWTYIQPKFAHYKERRSFIHTEFASLLDYLETRSLNPVDVLVSTVLQRFDPDEVHTAWQKALDRRGSDPEAAITSARTLLESVCKHILDERSVFYEDSLDLPKLYKLTAKQLKLAPDQHTEDIFKQILGGCESVVNGLGAVRNKLSDAHGKGHKPTKPGERHAELAVNLAGSMATFLIRTHQEQKTS